MKPSRLPWLLAFAARLLAADLEISRPVRAWEFLDCAGPKAAFFGHEEGTLEAWAYPLKIVRDLRLRFVVDGRAIPAASLARRIVSRPGSYAILYSGDEFEVRETLVAAVGEPGLLIRIEAVTYRPVRIDVEFARDFQLMWPASIGTSYGEWNEREKAFLFGADGKPYAAVLGSPDGALLERDYATNYSAEKGDAFTLGTVNGRATRVIALAGSMKSRDEAVATWKRLVAGADKIADEAARYYEGYLDRTVELNLPDKRLQRAYDWSRLSTFKGMVENPLLGAGLVAGYGPSKGAYRPGFAWFFGRDSFWTAFALTAAGDLASARRAIEFVAKYQRNDGKIPHEISQSASLVPWFEDYPYGFASADATPLFVIAVRNYVEASGDLEFLKQQAGRVRKAADFMQSTVAAPGFPANLSVGHGWVEGGPLLPVRVELYQAACYVEALRSLGILEDLLGNGQASARLRQQSDAARKLLNDTFWLNDSRTFAFALDPAGKPVNQPSVLATVPMWFGVLDTAKAQAMIETLSREEHATDWGMRIIASKSAFYSPEGYHFGSIWPLFTGWAAVGEYRSHAAAAGFANLQANAWLALDGAGGNTTEVLSGMTYSPLSTSSPHQIWSSAMVVSPLLRGLLGLEVNAIHRRIRFAPHIPADWEQFSIRRLSLGAETVDLAVRREGGTLRLDIRNNGSAAFEVEFEPAYAPPARILRASFSGLPAPWTEERNALDWHARFRLQARPGANMLSIEEAGTFGYAVPFAPPGLAEESRNLKVIAERWSDDRRHLDLTVSGRASRTYRLTLAGTATAESIEGARLAPDGQAIVEMPAGDPAAYVDKIIHFVFAPDAR
jgi:GH15 family glucan-1,4-alpha-glucosidase